MPTFKANPNAEFMKYDFNKQSSKDKDKGSHLHKLKPVPNVNGNRAERRAAKKRKKSI